MSALKQTPLFEIHKELNARMTNFSGWEMPVQYTGVIDEHKTVRNSVGLFDISHMGEIEIRGEDTFSQLQKITTNDVGKIKNGGVQYSLMCYDTGGIVDDILIYKFSDEHYLLCVNAANTEKDYEWIKKNVSGKIEVVNSSDSFCQLAIQGRYAEKILQKITTENIFGLKYYNFLVGHIDNIKTIISRTGYTGEDGFEIYFPPECSGQLWNRIISAGKEFGIKPVGLAARDTLRLEMKYMLYGNDIDENTLPVEAGLNWITNIDKGEFIGKNAIVERKRKGITKKLVGCELIEKGIPRSHYAVFKGDKKAGVVTSGTYSPSLNKSIAIAYIDINYSSVGEEIEIEIRDRHVRGIIVKTPFYERKTRNS